MKINIEWNIENEVTQENERENVLEEIEMK